MTISIPSRLIRKPVCDVLRVFGCYVALHGDLIRAESRHAFQKTADQNGQRAESQLRIETQVKQQFVATGKIRVDNAAHTAFRLSNQQAGGEHNRADKHKKLQHVGQHHGAEAAQHGVGNRDNAQPHDHDVLVDPRNSRNGDGRRIRRGRHPRNSQHDKQSAGQTTHRNVKTLFQIFVGRAAVEVSNKRE